MAALAQDSTIYARRLGVRYSAGLHISMILFAIFGLPTLFEWTRDPEPTAITVEIVPIGPITNIKPMDEAEKKPEIKPDTSVKPTPLVKTEDEAKEKEKPVPPTKSETAPPEDIAKPKEKPKEKKEETKKEKKQEDDLAAVLKSVEKAAQKQNNPAEKNEKGAAPSKAKSDTYDPTVPLSMTEEDMIRGQIEKNWSPPVGGRDAYELKVLLHISLNVDGTVTNVQIEDASRYASDPLFRAAGDAAIRAVWQASPLKGLSAEKYNTWRELRFNFDPKEALY
jgi:outer membrane biosynthesis protein TonB